MADDPSTVYDQVRYPGQPFQQSHPDRLATVASLYGMRPAPVPRCRVLELGCGSGHNLIPIAYQWPESELLGLDLSRRAIEEGRGEIAALGLTNIELRRLDIAEVTAELGRFDYIIAHGVYSWVPPAVRATILDIFKANLAPHGVAYVSYNCYPGAFTNDLARRMMLFHVRDCADPVERVRESRALLAFLAEASAENQIHGLILRAQHERIRDKSDVLLFHDDLDAGATPFFLYEIVEEAARHGLQYVADAASPVLEPRIHSEPVRRMLERIPLRELAVREQYLDFTNGRGFRNTLFCHDDVDLHRDVGPADVARYHLSALIERAPGTGPGPDATAEFTAVRGASLSTDHPLSKSALAYLGDTWPRAVRFTELVEQSLARLGEAADAIRARLAEEVAALSTVLFRAYAARLLDLHLYPPARLATSVSERPEASRLAREQAKTASVVTNLCHGRVALEDELVRQFLVRLDGTRDVDQLVAELNAAQGANGGATGDGPLTREIVERNLEMLARRGLLVS
jgi:SAM-dependent methyltransferase